MPVSDRSTSSISRRPGSPVDGSRDGTVAAPMAWAGPLDAGAGRPVTRDIAEVGGATRAPVISGAVGGLASTATLGAADGATCTPASSGAAGAAGADSVMVTLGAIAGTA